MLNTLKIKLAVLSVFIGLATGTIGYTPQASSEPLLGEIMMVGFTFAPRGWALCDGQILPINQNQSLYSLLGTMYGGDGRTSFALPDLRGRMPLHRDATYRQGSRGGAETVTLILPEMPAHTHTLKGVAAQGNQTIPDGHALAFDSREDQYSSNAPDVSMHPATLASSGGGQAHENLPPYLVINHCIALQGLFPSRQ